MATDKKITELPNATLPIAAGVKFEAVQGGVNVQVDADDMPGSGGGTWGSITGTLADQTDLNTALGLKAPLASPALTGTPTVPTAAANTNNTQAASTAYADAKVADAINDGTTTIAPSQNAVFDALALKTDSLVTLRTETATHDLDSTDLTNINAGKQLVIVLNAAGAISLEIPLNSSVAFPTGTVIGWIQYGVGQITITPLSTVVLRSPNAANKSFAQYSRGFIHKIGTDEWILSGDITV